MTAALVPVFSEYARDDTASPAHPRVERRPDERRDRLAGALGATVGAALLVLIPVVGLLIVAAPQIMAFMGEGFAPEMQDLGMRLVRLAMPSVAMLGIASVLMAAHYARERFVRPSFATALYNVGIIAGALLLTPFFGLGGLVLGLLAGAALQCAAQSPALRGVRWSALFDFRHPALRRIVRLYAPVAGGLVVSVGIGSLDARLASQTGAGSIAVMRYATTLVQLPLGLVATALQFCHAARLVQAGGGAGRVAAGRQAGGDASGRIGGAAGPCGLPGDLGAHAAAGAAMHSALYGGAPCLAPAGGASAVRARRVHRRQHGHHGAGAAVLCAAAAVRGDRSGLDRGLLRPAEHPHARPGGCRPRPVLYVVVALALVDDWGMPALVFANTVQNSAHGLILAVLLWRAVGGLRDSRLNGAAVRVGVAAAAMAGTLLVLDRAVLTPTAWLPVPLWGADAARRRGSGDGRVCRCAVAPGRRGRAPRGSDWAAGVAASQRGWSGRFVGGSGLPLAGKRSFSALGVMIGTEKYPCQGEQVAIACYQGISLARQCQLEEGAVEGVAAIWDGWRLRHVDRLAPGQEIG